jgi:hypothetical protein
MWIAILFTSWDTTTMGNSGWETTSSAVPKPKWLVRDLDRHEGRIRSFPEPLSSLNLCWPKPNHIRLMDDVFFFWLWSPRMFQLARCRSRQSEEWLLVCITMSFSEVRTYFGLSLFIWKTHDGFGKEKSVVVVCLCVRARSHMCLCLSVCLCLFVYLSGGVCVWCAFKQPHAMALVKLVCTYIHTHITTTQTCPTGTGV